MILQIRATLLAKQLVKFWCRNVRVVLSKANLLAPKVESKVNFDTGCWCSGTLLIGLSTSNNFILFIYFFHLCTLNIWTDVLLHRPVIAVNYMHNTCKAMFLTSKKIRYCSVGHWCCCCIHFDSHPCVIRMPIVIT